MKRCLPLALLLLVVAVPAARADGCFGPCNGASVNPPGTALLAAKPLGEGGPFLAYDTRTGRLRYRLHGGLASGDARWYFTVRGRRAPATIRRYDARTGRLSARFPVEARGWLSSISADGAYLTLTNGAKGGTAVHVVDVLSRRVVRSAFLPGSWEVETVSTDGRRLFLVEYLRGAGHQRYRIRLYDVRRGALRQQPIKGAGEPTVMQGWGLRAVASPDGRWLHTLYVVGKDNVAFVHALNLRTAKPRCIFLPSRNAAHEALSRYSLTLSADGRTLYAANPAVGSVARIDVERLKVIHTATFERERIAVRRLPQTTNGVLSPDGRTLYFTGARSVWAFDAAAARVRGPYRTGKPVIGLAWAGNRVHALRTDRRLVALDAPTGRLLSLR